MPNEHLATYLNDHLAGSVAAIDLMKHLEESYRGTELGDFVSKLKVEIEADHEELKALMKRLDIDESVTRKASAWLAEKVTNLKLRFDDSAGGDFRLFESFEALSLGIEGKESLWSVMKAVSKESPELGSLDYDRLIQRAVDQRSRVEERRMEAGRIALLEKTR